jgi:hypothetical protein
MNEIRLNTPLPRATMMLAVLLVAACICLLLVCGGDDDGTALTTVSGDAIPFINGPDGRIEGAEIWVLEHRPAA